MIESIRIKDVFMSKLASHQKVHKLLRRYDLSKKLDQKTTLQNVVLSEEDLIQKLLCMIHRYFLKVKCDKTEIQRRANTLPNQKHLSKAFKS